MSLDITVVSNELVTDFKDSILASLASDAPEIIAAATAYVTDGEQRLKDLAINTLNGDLAYDFVVRRLKEEETTLKDALIGIEQMIASDIQALVSNLLSIFENLLKTAILSINP